MYNWLNIFGVIWFTYLNAIYFLFYKENFKFKLHRIPLLINIFLMLSFINNLYTTSITQVILNIFSCLLLFFYSYITKDNVFYSYLYLFLLLIMLSNFV